MKKATIAIRAPAIGDDPALPIPARRATAAATSFLEPRPARFPLTAIL